MLGFNGSKEPIFLFREFHKAQLPEYFWWLCGFID